MTDELRLLADADARAATYLASVGRRRVFPEAEATAALDAFDQPFPDAPENPADLLRLLDDVGSPATVVSNGPRYFGFVIGAALPAAAAADDWRLPGTNARPRLSTRLRLRQSRERPRASCWRRWTCHPIARSVSGPAPRPAVSPA